MRDNIKLFVESLASTLDLPEPVLEIGSLQVEEQEDYADLRPLFGAQAYVGCDMRPGLGVECLVDAHRLPFRDGSIGTVLLLDTLEHVHSPFVAAEEARRVLGEGGVVVLASVMNFAIHSYPSDFWRFTPAAFDYLLEPLATRFILAQGDTEHPHTVIGVAMRPSSAGASDTFHAAIHELIAKWPDASDGGPFLDWRASDIVISQRTSDRLLPELEQGRSVAQSFVCPNNGMSRIDVKFSSLGRLNFSHLLFSVREDDEQQQEISSYRLNAAHIVDNGWAFVPFAQQATSAGRRYRLTIESPDAGPGQAVAAFASTERTYADGSLYVDGELADGSLSFQVYCDSPDDAEAMPRLETVGQRPDADQALQGPADMAELAASLRRSEERSWAQVRHLASVMESGFDATRADLKTLSDRLTHLERTQQQALEQSTEAAAITRALKGNPLYRLWRQVFRIKPQS